MVRLPAMDPALWRRHQWSKVIAAGTIEDEIKSKVQPLAATVATTSTFKSGGLRTPRFTFPLWP